MQIISKLDQKRIYILKLYNVCTKALLSQVVIIKYRA
jgi:hypothetical protein